MLQRFQFYKTNHTRNTHLTGCYYPEKFLKEWHSLKICVCGSNQRRVIIDMHIIDLKRICRLKYTIIDLGLELIANRRSLSRFEKYCQNC